MKEKICILIARTGMSGGTGTLSIRLAQWARENNYYCVYLCTENNSKANYDMLKRYGVQIVCRNDTTYKLQFKSIYNNSIQYYALTYSIYEYVSLKKIQTKYKNIIHVTYYDVHTKAYTFTSSNPMMRAIKKELLKDVIAKCDRFHELFLIDDQCAEDITNNLRYKVNKEKSIIRLPMVLNRKSMIKKDETRSDLFVIGTMSRIDIPFKGYLIGFLDWYKNVGFKLGTRLHMVANSADSEEYRRKIDSIPNQMRRNIVFEDVVSYDHIGYFFNSIDLFVGMGTSILDAANFGIPAYFVNSYTREFVVSGNFAENPTCFVDGPQQVDFTEVVKKLMKNQNNVLCAIADKQRDNLERYFDYNKNFPRLLCLKNTEFTSSNRMSISMKLLQCINKARKMNNWRNER